MVSFYKAAVHTFPGDVDRGVTLAARLRTPKALKRRCGRYLKEARPPGSSLPGQPGR